MAAAKTPQAATGKSGNLFTLIAIPACFVLAFVLYYTVFGAGHNFVDGDNTKDPLPGNYFGMVYKGGLIVPLLQGVLFTTIVLVIERFLTIGKAAGVGSVDAFVRSIKGFLDRDDVNGAIAACDKQRGSVGNVVRSGLVKYAEMSKASGLDSDQKKLAIAKEIEDATMLEMPTLEKNLNILATIASIATLLGLLGTVLGMIRSFAGLANAGAPDASALATGISEALINTALGIGCSAIAIIFYNYFTGRIDAMTYRIDESGQSLTQSFAAKHH